MYLFKWFIANMVTFVVSLFFLLIECIFGAGIGAIMGIAVGNIFYMVGSAGIESFFNSINIEMTQYLFSMGFCVIGILAGFFKTSFTMPLTALEVLNKLIDEGDNLYED